MRVNKICRTLPLAIFAAVICTVTALVCKTAVAEKRPAAELYQWKTLTRRQLNALNTHALYEPVNGCYLGAFIDFDPTLSNPVTLPGSKTHQSPSQFEQVTGKAHASYFFYLGYGEPLPVAWIKYLAAHNKFVHIALEPNSGLHAVQDNAYLRNLAQQMHATGARIFLRFASEMNGTWTAYHMDPAQYVRKFRLVYRIMHKLAPNVALVWCPYFSPTSNIDSYFPGDHYVDWVGVNIYNVRYHNDQLTDPGIDEDPVDFVKYMYRNYAGKHPLMICEYGASHYAKCEGLDEPGWAINKLLELYEAIPKIFPRVKAINYFDSDNMKFVSDGVNDYSVTDQSSILRAYKSAISSPFFLSTPDSTCSKAPLPIENGDSVSGTIHLTATTRFANDTARIIYTVDGHNIYKAYREDAWGCRWNSNSVRPGRHRLVLWVYNYAGTLLATHGVWIKTTSK